MELFALNSVYAVPQWKVTQETQATNPRSPMANAHHQDKHRLVLSSIDHTGPCLRHHNDLSHECVKHKKRPRFTTLEKESKPYVQRKPLSWGNGLTAKHNNPTLNPGNKTSPATPLELQQISIFPQLSPHIHFIQVHNVSPTTSISRLE